MNKHQLQELANQKILTDVGFVSHHIEHEEDLKNLSLESLSQMGIATSNAMNNFITPNFEDGGEITLQKDAMILYPIVIEKETSINLNGYNIINNSVFINESDNSRNSYVFWVKKGGKLTIKGEGSIKSAGCTYSIAIRAQGGEVTIEGGSYYNDGEGSDLIYASAGGKVSIIGGDFHPCKMLEGVPGTRNEYCALNIKDADRETSSIIVKGGTFYNFNPANNFSEGPKTNFVANGYISNQIDNNIWIVEKNTIDDIVVDDDENGEEPVVDEGDDNIETLVKLKAETSNQ